MTRKGSRIGSMGLRWRTSEFAMLVPLLKNLPAARVRVAAKRELRRPAGTQFAGIGADLDGVTWSDASKIGGVTLRSRGLGC